MNSVPLNSNTSNILQKIFVKKMKADMESKVNQSELSFESSYVRKTSTTFINNENFRVKGISKFMRYIFILVICQL